MDITFEDLNKSIRYVCYEDAMSLIMKRADNNESFYSFETFEQMVEQLLYNISPECEAVNPSVAHSLAYEFLKHRMTTAVQFMVLRSYLEDSPNASEMRMFANNTNLEIDFSWSSHEFPRADVVWYYTNDGRKSEDTFSNVNLLDAQRFISVVGYIYNDIMYLSQNSGAAMVEKDEVQDNPEK
jgi:hypothetical protein